jgi:hypothetical protein
MTMIEYVTQDGVSHHLKKLAALANKLARIAWAVLARGRVYQPRIATNAA